MFNDETEIYLIEITNLHKIASNNDVALTAQTSIQLRICSETWRKCGLRSIWQHVRNIAKKNEQKKIMIQLCKADKDI